MVTQPGHGPIPPSSAHYMVKKGCKKFNINRVAHKKHPKLCNDVVLLSNRIEFKQKEIIH